MPRPVPANATYRQTLVSCGKGGAGCRRCDDGRMHGPYWYACWGEPLRGGGDRTRSAYVGKELPRELDPMTAVTLVYGARVTALAARAMDSRRLSNTEVPGAEGDRDEQR